MNSAIWAGIYIIPISPFGLHLLRFISYQFFEITLSGAAKKELNPVPGIPTEGALSARTGTW